jgi:hypothetical protein
MKITYNTSGFLSENAYTEAMKSFLKQYDGRFPELTYLHLALEEIPFQQPGNERFIYSPSGSGLKIRVDKTKNYSPDGKCTGKPSSFEIYTELRSIFDWAVEEHLKNHQHKFRYQPSP